MPHRAQPAPCVVTELAEVFRAAIRRRVGFKVCPDVLDRIEMFRSFRPTVTESALKNFATCRALIEPANSRK